MYKENAGENPRDAYISKRRGWNYSAASQEREKRKACEGKSSEDGQKFYPLHHVKNLSVAAKEKS